MAVDDADVTVPLLPDRWEQLAVAIIAHSCLITCSYCGSCSPNARCTSVRGLFAENQVFYYSKV